MATPSRRRWSTVLKAAGNDLTRANVMKQATTLKDVRLPMLINGTAVNNSPERFTPMTSLQLIRFDGTRWVRLRRSPEELIDAATARSASMRIDLV